VIGFRWKFTPIVIFANMETVDTIFCCLTPDDRPPFETKGRE